MNAHAPALRDTVATMEPPSPQIAIVVLNWNGGEDTLECLRSALATDYPNRRVIVVDNGSSDGSPAAIRAAFPAVDLIETGANLGFAGGNNVGIAHALAHGADYVLLLNNDAEIDPGALTEFLAATRYFPAAGAFGGKIYFHGDRTRIWYAGGRWDADRGKFVQLGEGLTDDGTRFATAGPTDYACGCAFFVPAERFRTVGLLDEDFFLYFEESDWCYRAKAAGYPSVFVPTAKFWHKISVSFGGEGSPLAQYFITRNRMLWAARHTGLGERFRLHVQTLWNLFQRFVLAVAAFPRAQGNAGSRFRAWWWEIRDNAWEPRNVSCLLGYRDYWLRKFGDCPPIIRELAARAKSRRPADVAGH